MPARLAKKKGLSVTASSQIWTLHVAGEKMSFYAKFYRACFRNFHHLVESIIESTNRLALSHGFQSEAGPQDSRLIQGIVSLRLAVDKSRAEEDEAECEWKQTWNVPAIPKANTRWL